MSSSKDQSINHAAGNAPYVSSNRSHGHLL